MLHLALTLQLLAPQADVPPQLSLDAPEPPVVRLEALHAPTLLAERLSATSGVLLGQGASAGLALAAELSLGSRRLDPLHPTDVAGITFFTSELVLAPMGAALGAALAADHPGAFAEALAASFRARGMSAAGLAGIELVAALLGSPVLAVFGLAVLLGADCVLLPLAAATALHEPSVPTVEGPGSPVDEPPRAQLGDVHPVAALGR